MMTVGFQRYRTDREILEVEVVWVKQKRDMAMNRTELYRFTRPGTEKKSMPQEFIRITCCQNH